MNAFKVHNWSKLDRRSKFYLWVLYAQLVSQVTIVIGFFIVLFLLTRNLIA